MSAEYKDRLMTQICQQLGKPIMAALADEAVVEVLLNADGNLWVERLGESMAKAGTMSALNARALLEAIATSLDTEINADRPIIEGQLVLDGSRFTGTIPPLSSAPAFSIRKKATRIFALQGYVDQHILSASAFEILLGCLRDKKNIMVAGGTGTGKTTFANALMAEIPASDRLIIIEDTPELQTRAPNYLSLQTTSRQSMQVLLKTTLRLRPDRIIIGEVRGGEALTLLKAWNTGHSGGIATIHANSAPAALERLENLVAESGLQQVPCSLIAESVDVLVFISRKSAPPYRQITGIVELQGYKREGGYQTVNLA